MDRRIQQGGEHVRSWHGVSSWPPKGPPIPSEARVWLVGEATEALGDIDDT